MHEIHEKCRILVGHHDRKSPYGRPSCKLHGNINVLLKNIYVGVMWTKMAQNMVYWQEVVKVCGGWGGEIRVLL